MQLLRRSTHWNSSPTPHRVKPPQPPKPSVSNPTPQTPGGPADPNFTDRSPTAAAPRPSPAGDAGQVHPTVGVAHGSQEVITGDGLGLGGGVSVGVVGVRGTKMKMWQHHLDTYPASRIQPTHSRMHSFANPSIHPRTWPSWRLKYRSIPFLNPSLTSRVLYRRMISAPCCVDGWVGWMDGLISQMRCDRHERAAAPTSAQHSTAQLSSAQHLQHSTAPKAQDSTAQHPKAQHSTAPRARTFSYTVTV